MNKDNIDNADSSKRSERTTKTRRLFIEAGQRLFAQRGVDAVSVNEITGAAGQKNRTALQYHFGDKNGLLTAIIEVHAKRVFELRQQYLDSNIYDNSKASRRAAQALVNPLVQYIEENNTAVFYVKILSQLAAVDSPLLHPRTTSGISKLKDDRLHALMQSAVAHLQPPEAQRRLFLVVSFLFHSYCGILQMNDSSGTSDILLQRSAMFSQIALAVESILEAPPLQ